MHSYKLFDEIIKLSNSTNWEQAKREWQLDSIYYQKTPKVYLFGHPRIIEICVIKNKLNANLAEVGNVCVNKFLGFPSDTMFSSLRRIAKNPQKSMGIDLLHYANQKNWLSKWEYNFYNDLWDKKKLSPSHVKK